MKAPKKLVTKHSDVMADTFIQKAVEMAITSVSSGHGGPYGALIVKKDHIISASGNQVTLNNDPTAHAEIMTIRRACKKLHDFHLSGCILYCSCEPCPMCLGAIYWARLSRVYYACTRQDAAIAGFDDSFIYDEIALDPAKRHIPMSNLKHPDAHKPFAAWSSQTKRINY